MINHKKGVNCWWDVIWRKSMEVPQKKIEVPYNPAIPLLGIYPKEIKNVLFRRDICSPIFSAALFTIARMWRQTKCPSMDEWIKKMIHTHTREYYSAIERGKSYLLGQYGGALRAAHF